jgi:uncharacterized coiled-coil protein SlyX
MEQSRSKKPIDELSDSIKELSSDIKQIRHDLSYIKSKIKEQTVKEKVDESLKEEYEEVQKRWWW